MEISFYLSIEIHMGMTETERQRRKIEIKRALIFVIIHSTSKSTFSIKRSLFVFKQNSTTNTH
jgi:hypothetical protein